ncbi:MAG: FtsW/RodA/SpoVE family cell cycle protein [Bacteroidota bacterium]
MLRWILHRLKGDKVIWITVILIALSSLLAVYSASSGRAFRLHGGDTTYPVLRHSMHLLVGIAVMFLVHLVNYRVYARITNALLFITLALLIYTIAQGSELNDASRWITIFGQSFQPSDLAKITLMIYLAKLLTLRQEVIKDFTEGFLPALFWVTVICGLIAPEDLSTAALMFISSLMVMFVAGVELKYLGVLAMVAMMGLAILTKTAKRSST